jgi:hypothetical protein
MNKNNYRSAIAWQNRRNVPFCEVILHYRSVQATFQFLKEKRPKKRSIAGSATITLKQDIMFSYNNITDSKFRQLRGGWCIHTVLQM